MQLRDPIRRSPYLQLVPSGHRLWSVDSFSIQQEAFPRLLLPLACLQLQSQDTNCGQISEYHGGGLTVGPGGLRKLSVINCSAEGDTIG